MNEAALKAVARAFADNNMNSTDFCAAVALLSDGGRVPDKAPAWSAPHGELIVPADWPLQPRQRIAVGLWINGRTYTVIGETMGIKVGTVSAMLGQAARLMGCVYLRDFHAKLIKAQPRSLAAG